MIFRPSRAFLAISASAALVFAALPAAAVPTTAAKT